MSQKRSLVSNEELQELYVDQRLSTYDIAKLTGIPSSTVGYRLKKLGMRRSRSEAMSIRIKKEIGIWFTCPVCGKEKPLSELIENRSFVPLPRPCCKECAGF